jgi:pterin-4a-carbinolamine dehydratase
MNERRSVMTTKQKSETAVRSTGKKLRPPSGEPQKVGLPGGSRQNRLKAERVQEELRALPGWQLALDGKGVHRAWEFSEARVASAHAAFVNDLAEAEGRAAEITLSGSRVLVVLQGRSRSGVTAELLRFAKVLG